jgi:hypothetical protein
LLSATTKGKEESEKLNIIIDKNLKSPIAWKAKTFRTYKFYNKQVLEPVVSIFVHPFQKGGQKALTTSILTYKGRRDHKHFEADLLAFFAKQKFKGCIYPLDACVFSYAGVYVKIFKRCFRRNRRPFLGICSCHGFFGGWCRPFELH